MLRRIPMAAFLLAALAVLPAAPAFGQKKDKANDTNVPSVDADTLTPGDYTGKLQGLPDTDGNFVVRIDFQRLQLDQKALDKALKAGGKENKQLNKLAAENQHIAQLQLEVLNARTAKDLAHKQQQLNQAVMKFEQTLVQLQNTALSPQNNPNLYKTVTDTKDVTFHSTPDLKVRTANLPEVFDEKGNVKKYTKEELDALKGKDKNLPGYESSADKLQVGQTARATLITNKPPRKDDKKAADKKDDADKPADGGDKKNDPKPPDPPKTVVSVLLIVADAPSTDNKDRPKKNK